jgi:hypothetical protein
MIERLLWLMLRATRLAIGTFVEAKEDVVLVVAHGAIEPRNDCRPSAHCR